MRLGAAFRQNGNFASLNSLFSERTFLGLCHSERSRCAQAAQRVVEGSLKHLLDRQGEFLAVSLPPSATAGPSTALPCAFPQGNLAQDDKGLSAGYRLAALA